MELGGDLCRSGRTFEPNVVVTKQGDAGESMFIIHRGELEVLHGSSRTGVLKPGDYFGELVVFGHCTKHPVTVKTLVMCHLLEVSCVALKKALMRYPHERRQFDQMARRRPREKALGSSKPPGAAEHCSLLPPTVVAVAPAGAVTKAAADRMPAQPSAPPAADSGGLSYLLGAVNPPQASTPRTPEGWEQRKAYGHRHPGAGFSRTGSTEECNYLEQVQKSLKQDVKRGFRFPGAGGNHASMVEQNGLHGLHQTAAEADDARRQHAVEAEHEHHIAEEIEEIAHEANHLDLGLLPPVNMMSTSQKCAVLRHLEVRLQARRRLRKIAKSVQIVTSVTH